MAEQTDRVVLDAGNHLLEHVVSFHLVLNQRISLAVSLETDALAKLLHVVDVVHPLRVDCAEQHDALHLARVLGSRELLLLLLVECKRLLLQFVEQFLLRHTDLVLGIHDRLERNDREQQVV